MRKLFIAVVLSFYAFTALGQGTVTGKITDENGEAVIGAAVVLKSNHAIGVTTDLDGNYSLKLPDSSAQTLIISLISYKTIEETVVALNGKTVVKNFLMKSASNQMHEVEVTAKAIRTNNYYMEEIKKKSATTIDYISSETMKKTGDVNVVAAVARVPGVSTNGGFITVRGIGDRYVKTSINGSVIPTLDPFTNNIKLDLFPASLVDNILISKTASPDLPGDWAGAYLSVETKDYPDQLSVNAETSVGYNNKSTFKDIISSQHSSSDWLGYDNNFRDRNHDVFVAPTGNSETGPDQYQVLSALGLSSYYQSIGVTGWIDNSATGDTYFKLGLVQLGLLPPALFNDADAFAAAKAQYNNGPYKAEAFSILNSNVPATGKSFANNWNTSVRKAPLNFSQSFSIGNQIKVFGRPLGFIAGFRYGSSVLYDGSSTSNRASVIGDGNGNLVNSVSSTVVQQISKENNGWNMLMNAAYKLNSNHSVSVLFMPNFVGVNEVKSKVDDRDYNNLLITKSQFYEQRKQLVYQFKSEHYIPAIKLKAELNASYTNGKSSIPDFKNVQYLKDPVSNTYQLGPTVGQGIHRYYSYLSDNLFDSHVAFEFPLGKQPGLARKIKFGGAYQRNDKKSDQYDYALYSGPHSNVTLQNDDLDQYFSLNNFDIHTYTDNNGQSSNTIDFYYVESNSPANHTFGHSEVKAYFAMLDYSLTSSLRFSGGLRIEQANTLTDVFKFDSLGLAPDDPRREYKSGLPFVNPGKLDEVSCLPSANIIYKLKNDDAAPINVRVNFSQAVARPSIRELSDVGSYDFALESYIYGNSTLKMVHINNYDLRIESYFKSGDNASISFFYKDFRNHIELVKSGEFSWQNVDKSYVAGIELEGKKRISRHFEIAANVTLAESHTKFVRTRVEISNGIRNNIPLDTVSRTMFGQAPYVINGMLTYRADSLGLIVTVSYNIQGSRLVIASDQPDYPDVFERPRHLLDVKVSKTLSKHFTVSLTARDILDAPVVRSYGYTDGTKLDYDRYNYGTNYIFSVAYKL